MTKSYKSGHRYVPKRQCIWFPRVHGSPALQSLQGSSYAPGWCLINQMTFRVERQTCVFLFDCCMFSFAFFSVKTLAIDLLYCLWKVEIVAVLESVNIHYIILILFIAYLVQGMPLKIPVVDKKYLDLYHLHKVRITLAKCIDPVTVRWVKFCCVCCERVSYWIVQMVNEKIPVEIQRWETGFSLAGKGWTLVSDCNNTMDKCLTNSWIWM